MATDLYQWSPIARGENLPNLSRLPNRDSTNINLYIGRNDAQEVGKVSLKDGKLYDIWCHNGGKSDHGCVLVLSPTSDFQWKPFKSRDFLPANAVCGGETAKDGKVYVGRDSTGGVGKINLYSDGTIHNFWIGGHLRPRKEGEILVTFPVEQGRNPIATCDAHVAPKKSDCPENTAGFSAQETKLQVSSSSSALPTTNSSKTGYLAEAPECKGSIEYAANRRLGSQANKTDIVNYTYWERGVRARRQPVMCTAGVVTYLRSCVCCFSCIVGTRPLELSDSTHAQGNIEGVWQGGSITGTTLWWNDGRLATIHILTPTKFSVTLEGIVVTAALEDDGKLHWSNGDIWEKVDQDKREEHGKCAPLVTTSLPAVLPSIGSPGQ